MIAPGRTFLTDEMVAKIEALAPPRALEAADAGELERTIATYNAAAVGAAADPLARKDFGIAPLVPPLYGCRVVPGLFHTQGGLLIDTQAHVLRRDGAVIAHLFAGGGAAAGICGKSGARGYASGAGLLTAVGLGRIAGRTAAAELRS